jgi:hypothetical protein
VSALAASPLPRAVSHVDGSAALILDEDGRPTWRYRVAPFREAFLVSGIDSDELNRRCGWSASYHLKVLGLCATTSSRRRSDGTVRRYRQVRTTISYEHAVLLCRALYLGLVEWNV